MKLDYKPSMVTTGLLVNELELETIVFHVESNKSHLLNDTSSRIWNLCDGEHSVKELRRLLSEELEEVVAEDTVLDALKQLADAGLINEAPPEDNVLSALYTRRETLTRAAAVAAPLVLSVVAPAPAAAQSAAVVIPAACMSCAMFNPSNTCPVECDNTIIGGCTPSNNSCNNPTQMLSCLDCFDATAGMGILPSSWRA
jgi:Coenzyme PQQ synthesis protein D (PqqD)